MIVADFKDPEEMVDLSFDFARDAGAAQIVAPSVAVSVAVASGADPDVAGTVQGAPVVQGHVVFQRFRLGLHRVDYRWRCRVDLDDGRRLVLSMTVPVRSA